MILVDSIYINDSGGKALLDYFINTIIAKKLTSKFFFFLDSRGNFDYLDEISFQIGHASEFNRYIFYRNKKHTFSKIFCFGNVPPPVKCNVVVYTYFHNILLAKLTQGYPLKAKLLKVFKRQYIRCLAKNTDSFFVQSGNVKKMVEEHISSNKTVSIIPFYKLQKVSPGRESHSISFTYVGNANPHKNHEILLLVWEELFQQGYNPVLHLTVEVSYSKVNHKINELKGKGVKIENHGYVDAYELYAKSSFLIYPSLAESFGLCLVEAVDAGLNVIASDLPYVYEVISPSYVFDPNDVTSIVETVKKVLSGKEIPKSKILVDNKVEELILKLID